MESKEGLISIVSRELEKININYSLYFEEIPISTRTAKKKVIPELYSYKRNGCETEIVTVNEKRYKLFLIHKSGKKKILKSGTKESVTNFCNHLLELISQYNAGNTNVLDELFKYK